MKHVRHGLRLVTFGLTALAAASAAQAQAGNYPDKPVTIISDAGAGSSPDVAMRIVADGLGKIWGQNAAVVNHPGANGSIAARAASERRQRRLYAVFAGALDLPGVADGGAQPAGQAAARFSRHRIHCRPADVHLCRSGKRHHEPAATDRPRQKSAGNDFDRCLRRRPDDALDRALAAAEGGHQACSGAVYRRSVRRAQRRRGRARHHDDRGLSGHHRGRERRTGEADCGRVAAAPCRNFPICRRWRKRFRVSPRPAGSFSRRRSGRPRRSSPR